MSEFSQTHSQSTHATESPAATDAAAPVSSGRTTQLKAAASMAGDFDAQERALLPVQRHGGKDNAGAVHDAAAHGISGSGGSMPHGGTIQQSFGGYDISHVQAHTDSAAAQGSAAMGADAYATGNHVAFKGAPDLHTAAHEAAHVVQQQAGVQLSGGVGAVGDKYEQHADQVADAVVAGKSAEPILAEMAGGKAGAAGGVQQKAVQREETPAPARNGLGVANPGSYDNADATGDREAIEQAAGHAEAGDTKSATDHPAYDIFKARVANLNAVLELGLDVETEAQAMWLKLVQALAASERELDTAERIPGTKYIASDKAYTYEQVNGFAKNRILDPFNSLIADVNPWLNSMCKKANSFAFWSSNCAKEVAMTKDAADIGLESSALGSLFDGINFTGDWDNQLWAAVSRAYSQAIIKNLTASKQIRVYAAHNSRTENTTFTSVENPVVGPAIEAFKAAAPNIIRFISCAPVVKLNETGDAVVVEGDVPDWSQVGAGIPGTIGDAPSQPAAQQQSKAWVDAKKAEKEAQIPKAAPESDSTGAGETTPTTPPAT